MLRLGLLGLVASLALGQSNVVNPPVKQACTATVTTNCTPQVSGAGAYVPSVPPTGAAGGALTGTYPNPTVANLPTSGAIPVVTTPGVLGESTISDDGTDITVSGRDLRVRSSLIPQATFPPVLDGSAATFIDPGAGSDKTPWWMSDDRKIIYSGGGHTLYKSVDDGSTWTSIATLGSGTHGILGVRELANGELLVSLSNDAGAVEPGQLWLSSGKPQYTGAGATWTKVLDAGAGGTGPTAYFSQTWGLSTYKNIVAVVEYGPKNPPTDSARYAYLSTNYGVTWTQIFDLGTAAGSHTHGIAYDPWWDAIWITNGDGVSNQALRVSFDHGSTWTVVSTAVQFTSIIPLPGCILFSSDGAPNGVYRIPRTENRTVSAPVRAYVLNSTSTITHAGTLAFRAKGVDMPVLLPFFADSVSGPGVIVSTYDGYNFSTLWTDTISYVLKGPRNFLGPTFLGNYVGYLVDGRGAAGFSILKIPGAPVVAEDGLASERSADIIAALTQSSPIIPGFYLMSRSVNRTEAVRANGNLYASPIYLGRPCIIDRIGVEITSPGSAGSLTRLGIYRSDANGAPGTLLLDAGTIDSTGSNFIEQTINQPAAPGMYWVVAATQGTPLTAPTYRVHTGATMGLGGPDGLNLSQAAVSGYFMTGITGALPGSFTVSNTTGTPTRVLIRVQ